MWFAWVSNPELLRLQGMHANGFTTTTPILGVSSINLKNNLSRFLLQQLRQARLENPHVVKVGNDQKKFENHRRYTPLG